jgi:predicted NBD/HSP70 family sugar kinase
VSPVDSKKSGADHAVMREVNRSVVLDLIKQASPISRAAIAKATTLAKPTVSAIVDDLVHDGLVREIGMGPTTGGGRPPILLDFNARSQFVVGVHIGVRRTTVVVADARGAEVGRLDRATPKRKPADVLANVAADVAAAFKQAGVSLKRLAAVGVCVPGLIDFDAGICLLAPNLGWRDVDVRSPLDSALKVPVFVHNVAQTTAVAEATEGVGRGVENLVLLYVGSGVGVGILSGGRLFHGPSGIAGELGHCTMAGATERCNCGKSGCLETVANGPAIVAAAERAIAAGTASSLSGSRKKLTTEDIAAAAAAGDGLAVKILGDAGRQLGFAASWLVNIVSPELLVVAGDLGAAGEPLIGPLRDAVRELALPQAGDRVEIKASALGPDSEARGAVLLALQYSETYFRVVFQG